MFCRSQFGFPSRRLPKRVAAPFNTCPDCSWRPPVSPVPLVLPSRHPVFSGKPWFPSVKVHVYTYRRWISAKFVVPISMNMFRPMCSSVGSGRFRWYLTLSDVSTLYCGSLQLVGQQSQPIHYSIDLDFKHRSSRHCHIQHNNLSAASPSLLTAVLHALTDSPIIYVMFLGEQLSL